MNEPILIKGRSTRMVNKKPVVIEYSYKAAESTLKDEQIIRWAENREAELKRRKHEIPNRI